MIFRKSSPAAEAMNENNKMNDNNKRAFKIKQLPFHFFTASSPGTTKNLAVKGKCMIAITKLIIWK